MHAHVKMMLSLVKEAGGIALKLMGNSCPELKPDRSVITRADRAISALMHKKLGPLISTGKHGLIDEEDPHKAEYLDEGFLDRTSFIWAIDPIDATRAYANRMPHYGISLGIIKDRRPWAGAVYFPSLGELFYCDGENAYFVKNAFRPGAGRKRIKPVDEQISNCSVFILSDENAHKFSWNSTDCRYMVFSAAVIEFCWPCIGRGCGSLSRTHLWDMAGAWPIVEKAGLQFRSFSTGRVLQRLDTSLFEAGTKPWKLKDYYILSSERNFSLLRQRIKFNEAA